MKEELSRLASALEPEYLNKIVESSIHNQIAFIEKTIKMLEDEAKKIIESSEILKKQYELLIGIKGIGNRVALTIIADMPDVSNFKTAKQYAAFAGVTPSHFESGTSVKGKSRIARLGSSKIRKPLYMSALVTKNKNSHFAKWVETLENKGKPPKVIIVAVMRKLLHIIFGMLKNNEEFNEKLAFNVI